MKICQRKDVKWRPNNFAHYSYSSVPKQTDVEKQTSWGEDAYTIEKIEGGNEWEWWQSKIKMFDDFGFQENIFNVLYFFKN